MDYALALTNPGPDGTLQRVDWPPLDPGEGELRIRHDSVGVNFIDSYYRIGLYPLPAPAIPGVEGVGTVEATGPGVTGITVGQRVAYCAQPGAFAATRLLPAWRALPLPATIRPDVAAASMLRGMTAHMLLGHVHPVGPGGTVLILAAAGGLGGLLTQWAKALGAVVIGTVGTAAKAGIAEGYGADHVIVGRDADLVGQVDRITGGAGVDYAIDGIGGARLAQTIAAVRADGTVASIGQVAGPVPAMSIADISPRRAIRLARPSIMAFAADPEAYRQAGAAVFAMMERGILVAPGQACPLVRAADALADLEGGQGTGTTLLTL
ncbi:MAG: alcohol dehydrogenase [Rhodobacteraceae bacterium]|nr:alcohol dehydrogenase [Paracoccaceae bacterium]